jgi:UDP-N-acetylglucosamine--N-acetylmuramyl-(pentapeptide) pyrophosphoryl-undecaprenol N-acetylglucosamine transferase
MPRRVVFAGGGTGGHLYPALAIAEALLRTAPELEITFIGTRGRIEARVVPAHGFAFIPIWVSGFARKVSPAALLFPVKVLVSVVQSLVILLRLRPAVVVGTGGYVCGPPVFAATLLGIPALLQEQNSYPGITTRLLAGRVRQVHIAFEVTRRFLRRKDGVMLSGNPIRATVGTVERTDGMQRLRLNPARTTVLVVGGSQGAASINDALLASPDLLERPDVQFVWLAGAGEEDRVRHRLEQMGAGDGVHLYGFLEDMPWAYAAADVVVCRSGASTLAEILCAGLPSVLIPYPHAAADHQTLNARAMADAGAAVVIPDADVRGRLGTELREILAHPERRAAMSVAARSLARPNAARTLADAVMNLMKESHDG